MPTIILDEEWELNSTGVTKQPGTQLVFARGAKEAEEILEAEAGHILGSELKDPEDEETTARETTKSTRVQRKMEDAPQVPDPLPEHFPARSALENAGLVTLQQVSDAADSDLIEIDGIGKKTMKDIRNALT